MGSSKSVCFTLRLPARTGAPRMALGFAQSFREAGYGVVVVHGDMPVGEPAILEEFAAIGAECVYDSRFDNPLDPRLVRSIASTARQHGARCIIGVNQRDRVPALRAAKKAGISGVLMVQNQHRFGGNSTLAALKRKVYGSFVTRLADLAVCTSDVVLQEVLSFGLPAERAKLLPNGISIVEPPDVSACKSELRSGLGGDDQRMLLVNVGRLDRQKGQDILLEAIAEAPELHDRIRLALVGPEGAGPEAADHLRRMNEIIRDNDLGDVVTTVGWRTDIPEILAAGDGYVHSARWEGPALPLSVLEAMAAGVPTVFTDCSGVPDGFADGHHGWVARTDDAGSLLEALRSLVDAGEDKLADVSTAGARFVSDGYRVEELGRRFVQMVESVER